MLKKTLAITAIAMLFACSSDSDDDPPTTTTSSSSNEQGTDPTSSSSTTLEPSSSSAELVFELIYDFEELSENLVGYEFGNVSIGNEIAEEEDEDGNPTGVTYTVWNPDGIFTIKDFVYNNNPKTDDDGGGLMIKRSEDFVIENYSAFRFKIRGEAERYTFRIKVEIPNPAGGEDLSAAWAKGYTPTADWETITLELNSNNFSSSLYNNTGLTFNTFEEVLEAATAIEFFMSHQDGGTLEIDEFWGAKK